MRNHLLLALLLVIGFSGYARAGGLGLRVGADVPGPSIEAGPLVALDTGPVTMRFAVGGGISPTFKLLSTQAAVATRTTRRSPLSIYGGVRDELIIGRDENTNRIGVLAGLAISPPESRWVLETEGVIYVRSLGGALALRLGYLLLPF